MIKKIILQSINLCLVVSSFVCVINNVHADTYVQTTPIATSFETTGFTTVSSWITSGIVEAQDDGYQQVSLNFTFPMADKNFTEVNINTNGALTFSDSTLVQVPYGNLAFSSLGTSYSYFIAPFWDDLYARDTGQIQYKQGGVAPNRTFTVYYNNTQRYSPRNSTHQIQVVLHENGTIRYRYGATNTTTDNGQSATIGVYVNNTDFNQFSYNSSSLDFTTDVLYTPIITSAVSPVLNMHFDGNEWDGTDAILDSSGNNYHGTAYSIDNADGLLCNAADFSSGGTSDYIVVNHNALNGLTDFTAIAWIQTTQNSDATIFSASSSNDDNEAVFYFDEGERFWPTITETPFDTRTQLSNRTNSLNDGNWHQIVWVRDASEEESCFFFDGESQGCVTHPDNDDDEPVTIASGGFILGQEQDSLGGGFETNQSFIGLMDEFIIFSSVLSEGEISNINDNIRDGNNWDGSPRVCLSGSPVLDMRFDEVSWGDGVVNDVIDSSGNDFHGTAFGQTNPVEGLSCNAVDLSATGITDYVSVNYEAINGLTDFSIVFWGKQNSGADHIMTSISGFHDNVQNELLLSFPADSSNSIYKIRSTLNSSRQEINYNYDTEWHQYVWTRDSSTKQSCIYQDGALLNCQELGSGEALSISSGGFILGQNKNQNDGQLSNIFADKEGWDGLIDELLIFPSVLTQNKIQVFRQYAIDNKDWQGNIKSCNNTIDHYRFELPSSGLTCALSDIKIKACEDEFCSTFSPEISSLTLSPSGQWSGDNVTSNVVSFIAETGAGGVGLSHSIAESISITASNLNPIPTSNNPIQCFVGTTPASCEITFKDAGFIFSTTEGGNIPTQISNKPSSKEFNATTLTLQAVEKNTTTGACQAIFPENTNVDIELKLNCVSSECSNIDVVTESSTASELVSASYNNVPFLFNDDSLATYELTYPNAGEMSFSAQKEVTLASGATTVLTGTSNNFVVKPFGFKFEFPNDSDPFSDGIPNSDFTVFKKAGEEFSVNAIAIGWESGEDDDDSNNYNGMINVLADADDNNTVQFFSDESVILSHELQAPTTGVAGVLTASSIELSNSSASFTDVNWSEVGVISLTATLVDGDYLGTGDVSGTVANVGRFTPYYLEIEENNTGDLSSELSSGCAIQTFIGEMTDDTTTAVGALTYGTATPSLTIAAKNQAGTTTQNYHGDFLRFEATGMTLTTPTQDSANLLALTADMNDGVVEAVAGSLGVFTYTSSDDDHFVYTRNSDAKVAEFSANIQYAATAFSDADGVGLDIGVDFPILSAESAAGHKMYYGRIALMNAYGSEQESLLMPIEHQMFNGTDFVANSNVDDGVCGYNITPNVDFTLSPTTLGDLEQSALSGTLAWTLGKANLLIPAPNSVNDGGVIFELEVPQWLKYDWDNDAVTITNPSAVATFGRFRGNDRIINRRESR